MKKLNDIKSFFQDTEYLINNLKRELDLTRNLLYRTWVKNQKGCKIADDKVVVPDDIEFITTVVNPRSTVLSVLEITGSNYSKIGNQLRELGFINGQNGQGNRIKISTSRTVYEHISPYLSNQPYESFYIILLNTSNKLVKTVRISEGGISGTVVDPKKVFKIALDNYASGIVLSHNHPSGNLQPSESDVKITKKIIEAGKLLEIHVIDHLIIGDAGYFSFADEGIMD